MAVLTPVQNVLARISYSGIRPWFLWGCFIRFLELFLLTGVIGIIISDDGERELWLTLGIVFIGLCAVYFWKFALRTSAASLLLSLHPGGRDLVES
jgi:hypothetical protein